MKKQTFTYKPEILVTMAQEYLEAETEARLFYKKHRPVPNSTLVLSTAEDRIDYAAHDKKTACTWSAFVFGCRMVDADPSIVMGTVKAMNRFEKRVRWKVCAHLPSGYDWNNDEDRQDTLRRFWSVRDPDIDYFQSTGRQKPWTIKADEAK